MLQPRPSVSEVPSDPDGSIFLPERPSPDDIYSLFVNFQEHPRMLLGLARELHPEQFSHLVERLKFAILQGRNIGNCEEDVELAIRAEYYQALLDAKTE